MLANLGGRRLSGNARANFRMENVMGWRVLSVALLVGVTGLVGCIAVGGSDKQPTKGQELIDLKTALDRGAIDQKEYDTTKTQIMNRG